MKKHILLFVLMSSVLTSTALATQRPTLNRGGDCLLKQMAANNITLEAGGNTAFRPERLAKAPSQIPVRIGQ